MGAYFNVYLMSIVTGLESDGVNINEDIEVLAPLPNFGLIAMFKVTKWLRFSGKFGMFYLRLDDFRGKINDVNVSTSIKVYKCVAVNLSYKVFDTNILTYTNYIKTTVEYNYRGPSLGCPYLFNCIQQ